MSSEINSCFDMNDVKFEQYKEQNMTVSYTHLDVYKRQMDNLEATLQCSLMYIIFCNKK